MSNKLETKKIKGFTLVELLIAVSILTILTALGLLFFGGALKNARDHQRLKDLNTIAQALEMYRNDFHYYPSSSSDTDSMDNLKFNLVDQKNYLSEMPADPLNDSERKYQYKASGTGGNCTNEIGSYCNGFVLCAKAEGDIGFDNPTGCETLDCTDTDKCDMGISSQ